MHRMIATLLLSLCLSQVTAYASEMDNLIERLGLRESDVASRDMPGWSRPELITVMVYDEPPASGPGSRDWYYEAVDGVEIDFFRADVEKGFERLEDSDVYVGWCNRRAIQAGTSLRYIHIRSAGIDGCTAIPGIAERGLIASNSQKAASETIAEHSIALMLALTRNLHVYHAKQSDGTWDRDFGEGQKMISVRGKTLLVLGLGGIGSQAARRAYDLGMRVIGTRNSSRNGPDYVDYVGLANEMNELAAKADVVINALPLTTDTENIVATDFFDALKDGAYYISVGRGGTTDTDALIQALQDGSLTAAGLDVTDPEPLPSDHVLWTLPNVLITPHTAATSDASSSNTQLIERENLRRYVLGEKLLNLVDLERGY